MSGIRTSSNTTRKPSDTGFDDQDAVNEAKLDYFRQHNTDRESVYQACRANNLEFKPGINLWTPLLLMTMQGQ